MAREVMAEFCDVFLMWPETEASLSETMHDVAGRAAAHGRTVDFGLRVHVIVRESESEAMAAARRLMSRFDGAEGERLKHATQDSRSAGVLRQDALRENADADGFLEPVLWGEIGRARSGCGAALVGSPEQVLDKLNRYMDMGFRSFILSGYPLIEESLHFARLVLPHLPNRPLPHHPLPT
jgi:alkanesulfonate monooxygenase